LKAKYKYKRKKKMKNLYYISLAAVLAAANAQASGYVIPEQSLNSTARGSAYIAETNGADSSYFNPANMSWLNSEFHTELTFSYINLPGMTYSDNRTSSYSGDSKSENFLLPQLHMVSPDYNNFRFGISLIYPAGLTKRWNDVYPKTFAEKFALQIVEVNPTASYKILNNLSMGMGIRLIKADGEVKSGGPYGVGATQYGIMYSNISREMEGDAVEFGYNLAATYKPADSISLAATYRSKIEIGLDGTALLSSSDGYIAGVGSVAQMLPAASYNGGGSLEIPIPASMSIGTAYTHKETIFEFVYMKTFWSAYQTLDFEYDTPISSQTSPVLYNAFEVPVAKNWKNSNSFRFGINHRLDQKINLMGGYIIDKNPIPDNTLMFELPDSDSRVYSFGVSYKHSKTLEFGGAYLFNSKKTRKVSNDYLNGTFKGASAHLLVLAVQGKY
jgi:long-chain fatty acid transport protein